MADNAPRDEGNTDEGLPPQEHHRGPASHDPTEQPQEEPAATTQYPAGEYPEGQYPAAQYPADAGGTTQSLPTSSAAAERDHARGPDVVTLVAGLMTVALAGYLLVGGSWNLQWLLALGAVAVGVIMLVASVRPRGQR